MRPPVLDVRSRRLGRGGHPLRQLPSGGSRRRFVGRSAAVGFGASAVPSMCSIDQHVVASPACRRPQRVALVVPRVLLVLEADLLLLFLLLLLRSRRPLCSLG